MAGRGVERLEAPVVKDEQIDTAQRTQQTRVAAVAARQGQITEQPRDALIKHGAIVARQALFPSAEAGQLLPTPDGPQIKRLARSSIHWSSTSIVKRLRSGPRGAR